MRKWTHMRQIGLGSLAVAAIAVLATVTHGSRAAQILAEPQTTLNIVTPPCSATETPSTRVICDPQETTLVIREKAARKPQTVAEPRSSIGEELTEAVKRIKEPGNVSARLRLEVTAEQNAPSTTTATTVAATETRLKPHADSPHIIAGPPARRAVFNRLRSNDADAQPSADISLAAKTPNLAARPNVLRMGEDDAIRDSVRAVSYVDRQEPDVPKNDEDEPPAEEPREQTFAASPMNKPAERLGPFTVTDQFEALTIVERCAKILQTTRNIVRTEVADPNVCAVVQFTPGELSVVAKQAGQTQVSFWFKDLKGEPISYVIHVVPNPLRR